MKKTITYDFDSLKIVGVDNEGIYVTNDGFLIDDNEPELSHRLNLFLFFTLKMWKKLQKQWIDNKREYCLSYGHFCGDGAVISEYTHIGEMTTDGGIVDVYRINNILVDMEHG